MKEYPIFDINPEITYTPISFYMEPFFGDTTAPKYLNKKNI